MRYISLVATVVYGIVAVLLSTFPHFLAPGWLLWVSEWWGVFTSANLFLQAFPIAWILLFRPNTKDSWEWSLESADTVSSYVLAALILAGVPIINHLIPGDMIYWQSKIWIMSAFAVGVEFLIALIENKCQRNAPDGNAPAAGAHPPP